MIYTDMTHIIADNISELHQFCQDIGIKRCHFEGHRKPHYDIPKFKRVEVGIRVAKGEVKLKTSRELVKIIQDIKLMSKYPLSRIVIPSGKTNEDTWSWKIGDKSSARR